MKICLQIFAFFFGVFLTWLFFAFIGWLATPGAEYRRLLGHECVILFTVMLGWLPGLGIVIAIEEKID